MNYLSTELAIGKTLKFNSPEPRYYKMDNAIIYYSENNKDWEKSSTKASAFNNPKQWEVL